MYYIFTSTDHIPAIVIQPNISSCTINFIPLYIVSENNIEFRGILIFLIQFLVGAMHFGKDLKCLNFRREVESCALGFGRCPPLWRKIYILQKVGKLAC